MQESEGVLCMRVSFRIALAGQVIGVSALYEQTRTFCKNYLTDAPASFEVAVTPADIAFEREKNDREAAVEGHAPGNFSDEYLETLALYRKIVERLLEWDTLLFHGSCISVDSKAYLFTAKSGTGKSTHTQLWKKWFGERAVFINDDKPLLKISAQGVTVYGTPWDGKHRLFSALLTGDYASVAAVHSGEWMNRLTSDTTVVAGGVTQIVPGLIGMLVRLLGAAFLS